MARGARGDFLGSSLGQGSTSPSPCTHVQGPYGAPTGAVDRSLEHAKCTFRDHFTLFPRGFLREAHSTQPTECASRKKPREKSVKWSRKVHVDLILTFLSHLRNENVHTTRATSHLRLRPRINQGTARSCGCAPEGRLPVVSTQWYTRLTEASW